MGVLRGDISMIIIWWIKARGISGTPTYGGLILADLARREMTTSQDGGAND